uniref:Uncharacterized protein n=1 Tax=Oryza barthii TaxID=65489 RepID=A0A0D3EPZ4_9ORYZ
MKEGTRTRAEGTVFPEKLLITRLLQRDGEHYVSKDIIDRAMAKATANRYLKHDMLAAILGDARKKNDKRKI